MSREIKNTAIRFSQDWGDFISQRVDIAAFEMMTDKKHERHAEYKDALEREESLYSKLRGILKDGEERKAFESFKGAMEDSALCSVDTAYEQGLKDAFMFMRKFIL